MKLTFLFLAVALLGLPSSGLHSQALMPVQGDPFAALQTLLKVNDDLLKRQDASLKELVELTNTAHEARIFSKRG